MSVATWTARVHKAWKLGCLHGMRNITIDLYSFTTVTFDEFADKLRKIMVDYNKTHGHDMTTIAELKLYLDRQLARRPKKTALRSLRGIIP
jgi:hypothetical protein